MVLILQQLLILGGTLTIQGTANEVEVTESSGTVTVGLFDNVTISGNLTVSGTTTTVSSSTLNVADLLINLATNNNSSDSVDIGFYGLYDTSGSQDYMFLVYLGMQVMVSLNCLKTIRIHLTTERKY